VPRVLAAAHHRDDGGRPPPASHGGPGQRSDLPLGVLRKAPRLSRVPLARRASHVAPVHEPGRGLPCRDAGVGVRALLPRGERLAEHHPCIPAVAPTRPQRLGAVQRAAPQGQGNSAHQDQSVRQGGQGRGRTGDGPVGASGAAPDQGPPRRGGCERWGDAHARAAQAGGLPCRGGCERWGDAHARAAQAGGLPLVSPTVLRSCAKLCEARTCGPCWE
ncbi:hypothetical protein T484DRAFT_1896424, partial [Baffinella frigidus]